MSFEFECGFRRVKMASVNEPATFFVLVARGSKLEASLK